jgi:uncharacterized protein (DUF3820 family)
MPKQLTDSDLMPFGMHEGKMMINVPEDYLIWLYRSAKCTPDLKAYIEDSIDERKLKNSL